ncbi:hypothetical protein [Dendronalium sp. ChiSLP03b]|uniref:hypothetical protein n=1 Tax=Dendronalium sp. ChiSLP03b TaxID=3075381 RepID=UPI002AD32427|nr:hypothetical protein [Dendronalium sp. ChiSLP03b]MDZ8202828.1 hypothetical protein [Dendronalium sp. ChiSLP03b]
MSYPWVTSIYETSKYCLVYFIGITSNEPDDRISDGRKSPVSVLANHGYSYVSEIGKDLIRV